MKYIVALLVSVVTFILLYIALSEDIASKVKVFKAYDPDAFESKHMSKKIIYLISIMITVISFFTILKIFDYVSDPIGISKMIIAFLCMTGAGAFDYREKRIPNIFPLVMALAAIVLLALGVITKQQGAMQYIMWSVIPAVACGALFFVAAFITQQGIGAGDIKLICSLALLGGVYSVIGTLLYGVIACSVSAVLLLLTKKKTLKESLPFGPFLYVGFVLTVFLMKY